MKYLSERTPCQGIIPVKRRRTCPGRGTFGSMRLFVTALVVIGLAIAVAWGVQAAFVYAFLAGVAAALTYAAAVGGAWVTPRVDR